MKRADINLTAVVLLIGFTMAFFAIFLMWGQNIVEMFTKEGSKESEKTLTCGFDVKVKIIDACFGLDSFNNKAILLTIENLNEKDINGNFFLVKIEGSNDVSVYPTLPFTNLEGFSRKKIELTYFNETGQPLKVSLIPRIQTDNGPIFCDENKIESSIKNC